MDVDGQHPLQLTSDNGFESQPEWSSDGTRILYLARGGKDERVLAIDVATRTTDADRAACRAAAFVCGAAACCAARGSAALAIGEANRVLASRTANRPPRAVCDGPRAALAASV